MSKKLAGSHQIYTLFWEKNKKPKTQFSVPLFYEPDVPGQRKLYTGSVVGRKGEKTAFEILLRFPIPWGSVPNPEEGDTEYPHNVWLHS